MYLAHFQLSITITPHLKVIKLAELKIINNY